MFKSRRIPVRKDLIVYVMDTASDIAELLNVDKYEVAVCEELCEGDWNVLYSATYPTEKEANEAYQALVEKMETEDIKWVYKGGGKHEADGG